MRPKRQAAQRAPSWEEEGEGEQDDEEPPPKRRGRREGKEPVEQYEEEQEEEAAAEEDSPPRRKGGRRASAGGDGSARRSQRRVKQEPGAERRGAQQQQQGGGVSAGDNRAVDELTTQYRRRFEALHAKFEGRLSRQEVEGLVREVLRHMLFRHSEQPGVPVGRAELSKVVAAKAAAGSNKAGLPGYVVAWAQLKALECFGLEMREIAKAVPGARGGAEGSGAKSHLVLRSVVPEPLRSEHVLVRQQDNRRGLLAAVVCAISLAGGKLAEDELYQCLAELGVDRQQLHPRFGKVEACLDDFVRTRHLLKEAERTADGTVVTYWLGEQSVGPDAELGKAALDDFVEGMMAA